ncbi:MAG: FkbM family methyltransferase [Elusimicrobia bacterium]|nr:FkbM family methyltransferase [Elusimicrobiota bacterium]
MNLSRLKRLLVGRGSPAQRVFLAVARLAQLRFESTLRVDGHNLAARTSDRALALILHKVGLVDLAEKRLLSREVKPGMTCLDIGANIGVYTLYLARLVGRSGRVVAFEPEPENFEMLERNVARNGYAQVECVRKAVSDRTGAADLGFCEENRGDHRLFSRGQGRRAVPVETTRLDDFFPPGAKVDLIKMDVQGSEVAAMEGMRRVLQDNPRVMVLAEHCPALTEAAGFSAASLAEFWRDLGFEAFLVGEGLRQSPLDDPLSFAEMGRREGYLNVLFRRPAA